MGHVTSVIEDGVTIEVEVPPDANKERIIRYLEEEGIIDAAIDDDLDG